jgi:hypothetical protein
MVKAAVKILGRLDGIQKTPALITVVAMQLDQRSDSSGCVQLKKEE